MRRITLILLLLGTFILQAQSREMHVLVKEENANWWFCPNKQTKFSVHQLKKDMSYDNKQKALDVFSTRLMGASGKGRIKRDYIYLDKNDLLVVYQYTYKYSENPDKRCTDNKRSVIKFFKAKNQEEVRTILNKKLDRNLFKDRLIDYKLLSVLQPVEGDQYELLSKLRIKLIESMKNDKRTRLKIKQNRTVSIRG